MPWLLLPLLLACTDKTGDTATPTGDTTPDLPAGGCGVGWDWVPTDDMGEIIAMEELPELSLSADTVSALLDAQELGDLGPVLYDVKTWQIRYRTQDHGQAVEATGFVVLPDTDETVPILLWLHPTSGFSDACAPTAAGLEGAAFPILFASMGMAVAAPDYLGMAGWGAASGRLHPYIVAEPTAVASLDSVRALGRLAADEGAAVDLSRVIHWGASEGGFAALWTDRYLPRYAPELGSLGVVATIPPTDLPALAERAVTTPGDTTYGLVAVLTTAEDWFGAGGDLADVFTPTVADAVRDELAASCSDFPTLESLDSIEQIYSADFITAAAAGAPPEPFGCYFRQSTLRTSELPHESQAPVLMVLAEDDDLAYAPPAREDITALCAQGYVIEHLECAGASHVSGAVDSLDTQLAWVQARIAGEALGETCVIHDPIDCEAR